MTSEKVTPTNMETAEPAGGSRQVGGLTQRSYQTGPDVQTTG